MIVRLSLCVVVWALGASGTFALSHRLARSSIPRSSLVDMSRMPTIIRVADAAGAEVVFTETVRIPFYGIGVAGMEYGGGDYAGDFGIDAQKQQVLGYLQGFVEKAEASGLVARATVRTGNASQQIGEVAAESAGSIIVMASRGAGGLRRWVLGSVADKVIRSARRPVLVVPHSTS